MTGGMRRDERGIDGMGTARDERCGQDGIA